MATQTLTIRRPDDFHVHLRDGDMLRLVAPFTSRQFARAIVMPNLVPPITAIGQAADYRERIQEAAGRDFTPLLTCYLTDESSPEVVESGKSGFLHSPGDVEGMAASLRRLLTDETLRKKTGAAARERAETQFRQEKLLPVWEAYYERVLRGG